MHYPPYHFDELTCATPDEVTCTTTEFCSPCTTLYWEIKITDKAIEYYIKREEWLRLCIKEKPRWMPTKLWLWLLSKLLYLRVFSSRGVA